MPHRATMPDLAILTAMAEQQDASMFYVHDYGIVDDLYSVSRRTLWQEGCPFIAQYNPNWHAAYKHAGAALIETVYQDSKGVFETLCRYAMARFPEDAPKILELIETTDEWN